MRAVALGILLLAACDRNAGDEALQRSFDGADYKTDAAKIAHGKRLAAVLDCTGCHGANLQGQNVTKDDPAYGQMNAPNLTLMSAKYSDAEFEKLFREGVPRDGRQFWFMPVESFQFLSDADLAAIIAYVRSFKPAGEQLPPITKGKGFYEDLKRGFGDSRSQVARYRDNSPPDLGPKHARGRALVRIACTACHNAQLQGYQGFTPNLDIAGAYSKAELTRLLTIGEGRTKKNLGMMSDVARNHFSQMTPGERGAIVDYILARAHRPQPPQ